MTALFHMLLRLRLVVLPSHHNLHGHLQSCTYLMQDQLLKIAPQQQQVQYYSGTPVDLGVRIGTGLLVTLVVNKLPLLAAGSLCFPLWWPIYKAWWQNQKLRSQYRLSPSVGHPCLLFLAFKLFCPVCFCAKKMCQRSSYKSFLQHMLTFEKLRCLRQPVT